MNNPNEVIEYLKSYFNRNPMVGAQTSITKIEDFFQCKKTNKVHQSLYQLAAATYENHSSINLSREICKYITQADQNNLEASILLVTLLVEERSFLQAQPHIEQLLLDHPDNQQLLELQIQLHKRLKHSSKHLAALEQYLEQYPTANEKRVDLAKLLILEQPLLAFQKLLHEHSPQVSRTLFEISFLLYQIEEYDMALIFNNAFKKIEPLHQNRTHLGTRIKLLKPEKIYRFFIDQTEVRSYSDTISLSPDQYHFEFEDLNNRLFETFEVLKDGWDYEFSFEPELNVKQTHFIKTSKFKMKFDLIQQHKEIKIHLKKFFPDLFK